MWAVSSNHHPRPREYQHVHQHDHYFLINKVEYYSCMYSQRFSFPIFFRSFHSKTQLEISLFFMFSIDFWIEVYQSRPPCKCWQEQLPVRLYLSYLGCFRICAQGTLFTPIIQLRTTIPSITSFLLKKKHIQYCNPIQLIHEKTNHKTRYWRRNLCALHSNIIKVLFILEKREKKRNKTCSNDLQ